MTQQLLWKFQLKMRDTGQLEDTKMIETINLATVISRNHKSLYDIR